MGSFTNQPKLSSTTEQIHFGLGISIFGRRWYALYLQRSQSLSYSTTDFKLKSGAKGSDRQTFSAKRSISVGRVHHKIDFVSQSSESALPYGNSSALMFRLCFIRALYSQTWSCSCLNMLDQNSVALVFKLLYVKHLDSTKKTLCMCVPEKAAT